MDSIDTPELRSVNEIVLDEIEDLVGHFDGIRHRFFVHTDSHRSVAVNSLYPSAFAWSVRDVCDIANAEAGIPFNRQVFDLFECREA